MLSYGTQQALGGDGIVAARRRCPGYLIHRLAGETIACNREAKELVDAVGSLNGSNHCEHTCSSQPEPQVCTQRTIYTIKAASRHAFGSCLSRQLRNKRARYCIDTGLRGNRVHEIPQSRGSLAAAGQGTLGGAQLVCYPWEHRHDVLGVS